MACVLVIVVPFMHRYRDADVCLCVSWFRLQALWHAELKSKGEEGASLFRVFWRFCRTRVLVALIFLLISTITAFIGPVSASHFLVLFLPYTSGCRLTEVPTD